MLELGNFYGLSVKMTRIAPFHFGALVIVVALGVSIVLNVSLLWAFVGAVIFAAVHLFFEVWHQWGHFYAAKLTGYPMRHVVIWSVLGKSIYPKNEPKLSAAIHRQRAFGGPIASLLLSLPLGLVALFFYFAAQSAAWLPVLIFLDNFLIFFLGAFIPLHFLGIETDGSTLLKYWRQA